MADQDAADHKKRLVDVETTFVTDSQAAERMQPIQGAFNHPAIHAQTTAVFGVTPGDVRLNAHLAQDLADRFGIVPTIGVELIEAITRSAAHTRYGRNLVDQFKNPGDVVTVGGGGLGHDGNPIPIGQQMVFGAWSSPVYGAGAGRFAPPFDRTMGSAVHGTATEVDLVGLPQCAQYNTMDGVPNTGLLPIAQPPPISCGNISHGMPDTKTKMMLLRHTRSERALCPEWRVLRGLIGR